MKHQLNYGTSVIQYSVSYIERKTLAIEVYPDLSIKVVAPLLTSLAAIEEKLLKRAQWIRKQQHYFEQFLPKTPAREYVSGETHYYLGKRYILRVRKSEEPSVKLKGAELVINTQNPQDIKQIKEILTDWYYQHALRKFQQSITQSLLRLRSYNLDHPPLVIRRMPRRWGSCTPKGRIIINPEIIKAPSKCIDYVIIHELCHLVHHNHSQEFYELQNLIMPDWQKWKNRLEQTLA